MGLRAVEQSYLEFIDYLQKLECVGITSVIAKD
jgi:hypothetical protein